MLRKKPRKYKLIQLPLDFGCFLMENVWTAGEPLKSSPGHILVKYRNFLFWPCAIMDLQTCSTHNGLNISQPFPGIIYIIFYYFYYYFTIYIIYYIIDHINISYLFTLFTINYVFIIYLFHFALTISHWPLNCAVGVGGKQIFLSCLNVGNILRFFLYFLAPMW